MATKRDRIKAKTQGRCAYCGCELPENGWHADHIDPIFRGWENRPDRAGDDVESNLFASCRRCNLRKGTLTVDVFRSEITKQGERLRRNVAAFRLAEDYGIVQCVDSPVVFYFEKLIDKMRLKKGATNE